MAGYARLTALPDACVLFPLAMVDSLMSLAEAGLYAAKWSTRIEEEWIRALETKRPDLKGRLGTRRDAMREAVPDWEVLETAWKAVVGSVQLPDPDDAHVLAAAIAAHADCIVTVNLRHFPDAAVGAYGIEVVDPDKFIINQWDLDQLAAVAAFKRMRARWKKPQATPEDFAQALERGGLPATAIRLLEARELI
jgi:predicted nucleic acid-binding protein